MTIAEAVFLLLLVSLAGSVICLGLLAIVSIIQWIMGE